jgi:hypothetical protein
MKTMKQTLRLLAFVSVCLFASCEKDALIANLPPDTHLSVKAINLSGDNRLNSTVNLSWYGTDADGYVIGYEYSVNGSEWIKTESQDSTFRFPIAPGQDTTDVVFRVRAIDNDLNRDETPAELVVPLKNAPPVAEIESASFPRDTAHLAFTFRWKYSDPDGNQTVTKAFIRLNDGNWTEIDRSKPLITLIAKTPTFSGYTDAHLYYNTEGNPSTLSLSRFNNGGDNVVYLKVVDIAGTESVIDTSLTVFVKSKKNDLLFINGQSRTVANAYAGLIGKAGLAFDFIDLNQEGGKYMPFFWNPTYTLMMKQYPLLFLNTDQSLVINPSTGSSGLLLELMASVMQSFTDNGGKSFITTSFPSGQDLSLLRGVYPIDSISTTSGMAVIQKDSSIYNPANQYPTLSPKNLLLGIDPMIPSVDATALYKGKLTPFGAWKGPDVVGVKRTVAGKVRQIFFSVELYLFNQDETALNALFNQVFNTDLQ